MKKRIISLVLALVLMMMTPLLVLADIAVGDSIVTLGENLTQEQKNMILGEFNPPDDAVQITVSNAEEHRYLGDVIPAGKIGNKTISSAMITYTEEGSGITVTTKNINYVTDQTYINALITVGVNNADIKISAPFEVSGTGALTGIMKAYETSSGEKISEDIKKAANEEMVTTAELVEEIGDEKATDLINEIKKQIAETDPKTKEEIKNIVINVINNYNLNLNQEQIDKLVALFDKMKDLDIDWNRVKNQIEDLSKKASNYLSSEEGQSFLTNLKSWFSSFIDWVQSQF